MKVIKGESPAFAEAVAGVEAEAGRYQEAFNAGVQSVLYARCMTHREVPQYNNAAADAECPVCEVERVKRVEG